MKLVASLVLSCLAFTTGCVHRYEVTLTNQRVITAHGKPKYDKKQGTFRFKDAEGRAHVLPSFMIQEIAPR